MGSFACFAKRHQVCQAIAIRHGVRNVRDRLRRLADRNIGDHLVAQRVDHRELVGILESDIDAGTVTRRPDAMRQIADGDGCDQLKRIGAEHLHLVEATHRHVGKAAVLIGDEIDVIGDRAGIHRLDQVEGCLGIEDLRLADILQREPDLFTIRRGGDVGAEWAFLLHMPDDLMVCDGYHDGLRVEGRADITILPVRREDLHAGTRGHLDLRLLLECRRVDDRDIVFPAHGHPNLLAIGREEGLVRRAADIGRMLHRIRSGVDEGDGIGADRNDRERLVVRREPHAVNQDLALVERAQIPRLGIAELDDAEQLVGRGVADGNRVGELLGGIDAVLAADRDIRI